MSFTQTVNEEGSCIAEPSQTLSATCAKVDDDKDLKTKLPRRPVTTNIATTGAATTLYEGKDQIQKAFYSKIINSNQHSNTFCIFLKRPKSMSSLPIQIRFLPHFLFQNLGNDTLVDI